MAANSECETRFMNGITEEEVQTRRGMRKHINVGRFGRINKDLLVFKLYYFFVFSGQVCVKPFLPIFFRHVGMSAEQTGMLLGLQPLARLIAAPLSGALADKYRKHRLVMMVMCVVSTVLYFSLAFLRPSEDLDSLETNLCSNGPLWNISKSENFSGSIWPCSGLNCSSSTNSALGQDCGNHSVFKNRSENVGNKKFSTSGKAGDSNKMFIIISVVVFVGSFFGSFNSLGDAVAIKYLSAMDRGGDYGKQRLWGAVGWGTIAIISGFAIDESAQNLQQNQFLLAFCGFLFFNMATVATIFKLPMEYLEGRSSPKIFQNLWTILSDYLIVTFLLAILIMGTCMSTIEMYLFWFLQDLNGSHLLMGLSLCMTCMAEVPVMFFSGHLIKRMGHHGVLYLTFVCYTIRYVSYSFISNAWYVLAIEPLHGVTFGAMWAATTSYGGIISPEGLAATVMGLVTATHFGLGRLIAGFGGGFLYSKYGPRVLFRSLAVTSVVTCALFALSQKLVNKKSQKSYSHFQNDSQDMNSDPWDLEMREISLDSGDEM